MNRQSLYKTVRPKYQRPAAISPRPGELTMKQFCHEISATLGISPFGVFGRIRQQRLAGFSRRRVNARVVFVRPHLPLPEFLLQVRERESARLGSDTVIGPDWRACRPGEIPMMEWFKQQAKRLRISAATAKNRFYRGQLPCPPRRDTGWRTFVRIGEPVV